MKGSKILYLVWVLVLIGILFITLSNRSESAHYYGIAETREIVVNSESPVGIKMIHVVPGQVVEKGQLLVELDRPELTMKINDISHQLQELKIKKHVSTSEIRSQINQLEAQKASTISDINYKIKQLTTQQKINRELASDLKSIERDGTTSKQTNLSSPISIRIESLKKELELALNLIQIKIDTLKTGLNSPDSAAAVQAESLEKELNLLFDEKSKLLIFSKIRGIIGSVNFKEGEKISPFAPILTLHAKSPSYVKGYIHEDVYSRVSVGEKVNIVSLSDKNTLTTGEVVGVGSRIVPYPMRLMKRPDIQVWGREVQIKIPEDNHFLLGEKVLISPVENGRKLLKNLWTGLVDEMTKRDVNP